LAPRAGSASALRASIWGAAGAFIATARDDASKLDALAKDANGRLRIEQVDIADAKGVAALRQKLAGETLDLLFVVAGISGSVPKPLHEVTADEARRSI